jgi:nitrogen fixation protein NifB
VTITINAIHPKIGQIIYSWVLDRGRILRGTEAAERLLDQQFTGLQMLSKQNLIVKVNTVLIPGINEDDILPLARAVQPLGAEIINVMPLIPVAGSEMEKSEAPSPQQLYKLRKSCGEILPSMPHCKQCRADAIGFLGVDRSMEFIQPENPKGSIQGQQVEPTTHQYSCAYD